MEIINLSKRISPARILISDAAAMTKQQVLRTLCEMSSEQVNDLDEFTEAIYARERVMSTGLGIETAFPHVKIPSIPEFFVTIGIFTNGIEWDSLDGQPVHFIFLIGGPDAQQQRYLGILSKLCLVMKNATNREQLINATTAEQVVEVFKDF